MRHAPKDVDDFAVIARTCVEAVLGVSFVLETTERTESPTERLIAELIAGHGFRRARRSAGFDRSQAKSELERLGKSCVSLQARNGGTQQSMELRHLATKAFSAKPRRVGERIDPLGPLTVWSHGVIHQATKAVVQWCVGPNNAEIQRHLLGEVHSPVRSLPELADGTLVSCTNDFRAAMPWFDGLDSGLARKVYGHAVTTAFWFTAYNYCHMTDGSTPAMRIGWTQTPWSSRELSKLLDV